MRRLITLIALVALCLPLSAATEYGITICGIKITSDNCGNVTGPGLSGRVSYSPSSNLLVLDNVKADCQGKYNGLNVQASVPDGLRIWLIGENYFYNFNGLGFALFCPRRQQPNCKYNFYLTGESAILILENSSIATFNQASLCLGNGVPGGDNMGGIIINADSIYSSKDNEGRRGGVLAVNDAVLNLRNGYISSMYGFDTVKMEEGMEFYYPKGARYSNGTVVDANGNVVKGETKLGWKRFGISVAGVEIHEKNYKDIRCKAIGGELRYDPKSNWLSLKDARLNMDLNGCQDSPCVDIYGDGDYLISCTGDNYIVQTDNQEMPAIRSKADLYIGGEGTLEVGKRGGKSLEMLGGANLCFLRAEGVNFNGDGIFMSGGSLSVTESNVTAWEIAGAGELTYEDCEIDGLVWDESLKAFTYWNSDTHVGKAVSFKVPEENYGVYIAGHGINNVNANFFHYPDLSGTVTAEVEGDTVFITLKNVMTDIRGEENAIGVISSDRVNKIVFIIPEGTFSQFGNRNGLAFYAYNNVSFQGGGKLIIAGTVKMLSYYDLTLGGIDATFKNLAARDEGGEGYTLVIDGPGLNLLGNNEDPTIAGFNEVKLAPGLAFVPFTNINDFEALRYDFDLMALVDADGKVFKGPVCVVSMEEN